MKIVFKGEPTETKALAILYKISESKIIARFEAGYRGSDLVALDVHPVKWMGKDTSLTRIAETYGLPYQIINKRWKKGVRDSELVAPVNGKELNRNAAKLNEAEAKAIKDLALNREMKQKEIAERFGVSVTHVKDIKAGRRWSHLL